MKKFHSYDIYEMRVFDTNRYAQYFGAIILNIGTINNLRNILLVRIIIVVFRFFNNTIKQYIYASIYLNYCYLVV